MKVLGDGGLGVSRCSNVTEIPVRFQSDGRAIRCSPHTRARLGQGGWDTRAVHGAMREVLDSSSSSASSFRAPISELGKENLH